ncbi:MAG TPA: hypothetical protein VGD52_04195, partial [Pseudoduganella sp.]
GLAAAFLAAGLAAGLAAALAAGLAAAFFAGAAALAAAGFFLAAVAIFSSPSSGMGKIHAQVLNPSGPALDQANYSSAQTELRFALMNSAPS